MRRGWGGDCFGDYGVPCFSLHSLVRNSTMTSKKGHAHSLSL
ncbi:hypothetical protein RB930 [Rhodopirellula baltica SH 1]|uniref:Uncharacterized protein n=1 Tax=Rhodopirellula baltica (strain DSM 10527 / NCIMB 13988 / SH1) TaxID=243090 RepID=Q7UY24_RHOBA|nr:hypothetical protein RB930 [Rhodopirellula baltica SH 1]